MAAAAAEGRGDVVQVRLRRHTDRPSDGEGRYRRAVHLGLEPASADVVRLIVQLQTVGVFRVIHEQGLIDDGDADIASRDPLSRQGAQAHPRIRSERQDCRRVESGGHLILTRPAGGGVEVSLEQLLKRITQVELGGIAGAQIHLPGIGVCRVKHQRGREAAARPACRRGAAYDARVSLRQRYRRGWGPVRGRCRRCRAGRGCAQRWFGCGRGGWACREGVAGQRGQAGHEPKPEEWSVDHGASWKLHSR